MLSGKCSVSLGEWYILQMEAKVSIIYKCQLRLVIYISWLSCVYVYTLYVLYTKHVLYLYRSTFYCVCKFVIAVNIIIEGGGTGIATVKSQSGYVAMGTGGFYSAQFENFAIHGLN